jgi:hypothetical protein
MAQANDSILVTPGSGAAVATHTANAKEHQVVMVANENGHIAGTAPRYRLFVPKQAVGANKVYFDLFNATSSGKTLRLLSCTPVVSGAVAVSGTLAVDLFLTRTTDVGTGGTAATGDGVSGGSAESSVTAMSIAKANPADSQLPSGVTARLSPSGGGTGGQVLAWCSVFTEETNAGTYFGIMNDLANRLRGTDYGGIIIPENTGVRIIQGSVASVGNIGFDLIFTAE